MKLLQSKLSHPELSGLLIDRPRLSGKILKAKEANLFFLVAPAGFGKTVLVLQTLKSLRGYRWGWFNVDSRDGDPERFLAYLIKALSRVNPLVKVSGIDGDLISENISADQITDNLCCILHEYRGPEYWLVLDNCEAISENRHIWEIVQRVSANSRGKLKLVVCSRTMPPLKLNTHLRSGKALLATKQELALTIEEFIQATRLHLPDEIDESVIQQLWEVTSGWFIGLSLILQKARHYEGHDLETKISEIVSRADDIRMFIQDEFLDDLDGEFVDAILRCSLLDELTIETCSKILGGTYPADRFLFDLKQSMIPHSSLPEEAGVRLHPLVRQVARRLLRTKCAPHVMKDTFKRAASIYISRGESAVAIDLLLHAGYYKEAIRSICDAIDDREPSSGPDSIEAWLERVPVTSWDSSLYIKAKAAALSMRGKFIEVAEFLSDKLRPSRYEDTGIYATLWLRNRQAALFTSKEPQYSRLLSDWNRLVKRFSPLPVEVLSMGENTLAHAAHNDNRLDTAVRHLARAMGYIPRKNVAARVAIMINIGTCHMNSGEFDQAVSVYRDALKETDKHKIHSKKRLMLSNLARTYDWLGQFSNALEAASNLETVMNRYNLECRGCSLEINVIKGRCLWRIGQKEKALDNFESALIDAEEINYRSKKSLSNLYAYYSHMSGSNHSGDQCSRALDISDEYSLMLHFYQALKAGDFKQMGVLCRGLQNHRTAPKVWDITVHFLSAYWAYGTKRHKIFKDHLRKGLQLLGKMNTRTYEAANDIVTSFAVTTAIRFDIHPKLALRLVTGEETVDLVAGFAKELAKERMPAVERRRLLDAANDLEISGLPNVIARFARHRDRKLRESALRYLESQASQSLPPLIVNTFGRFSVVSNGRTVHFRGKIARNLIQIMLINYPRPVHKEVLVESLWGDLPPGKGESYLRPRISDLRRALDSNHRAFKKSYITCENNHYCIHLPTGSSVDVLEFRKIADSLTPANSVSDITGSRIKDLRRSSELFDGEFLPDERYEPFAEEYRGYLNRRFLSLCGIYADYLISENRTYEAIQVIEHGLKVDHLWSDGVVRLMKVRVHNNELYKALRLYRDYEARIQQELDLPPHERLRAYFENLVRPQEE